MLYIKDISQKLINVENIHVGDSYHIVIYNSGAHRVYRIIVIEKTICETIRERFPIYSITIEYFEGDTPLFDTDVKALKLPTVFKSGSALRVFETYEDAETYRRAIMSPINKYEDASVTFIYEDKVKYGVVIDNYNFDEETHRYMSFDIQEYDGPFDYYEPRNKLDLYKNVPLCDVFSKECDCWEEYYNRFPLEIKSIFDIPYEIRRDPNSKITTNVKGMTNNSFEREEPYYDECSLADGRCMRAITIPVPYYKQLIKMANLV